MRYGLQRMRKHPLGPPTMTTVINDQKKRPCGIIRRAFFALYATELTPEKKLTMSFI